MDSIMDKTAWTPLEVRTALRMLGRPTAPTILRVDRAKGGDGGEFERDRLCGRCGRSWFDGIVSPLRESVHDLSLADEERFRCPACFARSARMTTRERDLEV